MATAFTRGLQGNGPYWTTASLLKHFLANSNENGRGSSSSDFDMRLFQEYYSVPFRMAIEDGHANAFMTAYNSWNNTPMIENPVLRSVVMPEWGFNGIICTDGGALGMLVHDHHAYATMPEAAAAAIHAGINQFLDNFKQPVEDALQQKLITEADLDRNLRGVFRVMIKLGMLDPNPRVANAHIGFDDGLTTLAPDPWDQPAAHALARKVTDESIVLLKNQNKTSAARQHAPQDARRHRPTRRQGRARLVQRHAALHGHAARGHPRARRRKVTVNYADGSDLAAAAALA